MKISDIINFDDYTVKWDVVWKIKEFNLLKTIQQTKTWHSEGVVAIHTKNVVNTMYELIPYNGTNAIYRLIMILSALFHDIGKGDTTFFSVEKRDWVSPNHDAIGEQITRRLLKDENYILRDSVCYFVRNHMKPLYISESPNKIRDIIKLSHDGYGLEYCTNENLILLKTADNKGSIMLKDDKWEEKLEYAVMLCNEQHCLKQPYPFKNEDSREKYFNDELMVYP